MLVLRQQALQGGVVSEARLLFCGAGELLALKEVAVMVGDNRNKEAVEQLEREVSLDAG